MALKIYSDIDFANSIFITKNIMTNQPSKTVNLYYGGIYAYQSAYTISNQKYRISLQSNNCCIEDVNNTNNYIKISVSNLELKHNDNISLISGDKTLAIKSGVGIVTTDASITNLTTDNANITNANIEKITKNNSSKNNGVVLSTNLLPEGDEIYDIGDSYHKLKDIYCNKLHANNLLTSQVEIYVHKSTSTSGTYPSDFNYEDTNKVNPCYVTKTTIGSNIIMYSGRLYYSQKDTGTLTKFSEDYWYEAYINDSTISRGGWKVQSVILTPEIEKAGGDAYLGVYTTGGANNPRFYMCMDRINGKDLKWIHFIAIAYDMI